MKQRKLFLWLLPLLCGILGLCLYATLMNAGQDARKLLIAWHWSGVALCVLSVAVLAGLYLLVRPLQPIRCTRLFPASALSAVGCWIATACLCASVTVTFFRSDKAVFAVILCIFGLLAAACLLLTGISRLKGRLPNYMMYAVLSVYFMLRIVSQYRSWSREPQVFVYLFSLLSSVALMFTAYQCAALTGGKGSRRWFVFFNRAALFFCCVSLAGAEPLFYLSMAVWTGTGLCSVQQAGEA